MIVYNRLMIYHGMIHHIMISFDDLSLGLSFYDLKFNHSSLEQTNVYKG